MAELSPVTPAEEEAAAALSCEALEAGAALALRASPPDVPAFERHAAMLAPFYSARRVRAAAAAAAGAAAPAEAPAAAAARQQVQGLALMALLVEGARLERFHCAVERLSAADRAAPAVAFPLALEAQLSEGSYNKILQASTQALPSALFAPLMAKLVGTVRDDIAGCAASAYASLTVAAAQKMLMLDSPAAVRAYAEQRALGWHVSAKGVITFPGSASAVSAAGGAAPRELARSDSAPETPARPSTDAYGLMSEVVGFATSIERII